MCREHPRVEYENFIKFESAERQKNELIALFRTVLSWKKLTPGDIALALEEIVIENIGLNYTEPEEVANAGKS